MSNPLTPEQVQARELAEARSERDALKAKVDDLESLVQRLHVIGPDRVIEPSSNPCKLSEPVSDAYTLSRKLLGRTLEGDHYADSIHVTEHGGIGINVAGHVVVMPLRGWMQAARQTAQRCETCRYNDPKQTRSMGMTFDTPWCHRWNMWRPFEVNGCTAHQPKEQA